MDRPVPTPGSSTPNAVNANRPSGVDEALVERRASAGHATSQASIPLALTVHEAARLLRLDPRTIRAMIRAGELEGNHRGHAIRVSGASVLEWLRGKRRVPRSKE
jgi:excisionase family DNA binding protein